MKVMEGGLTPARGKKKKTLAKKERTIARSSKKEEEAIGSEAGERGACGAVP